MLSPIPILLVAFAHHADTDYQVWTAGQVIGLIHDIPTCKDLVERISVEAEGALKEKLELVSPTQSKL